MVKTYHLWASPMTSCSPLSGVASAWAGNQQCHREDEARSAEDAANSVACMARDVDGCSVAPGGSTHVRRGLWPRSHAGAKRGIAAPCALRIAGRAMTLA